MPSGLYTTSSGQKWLTRLESSRPSSVRQTRMTRGCPWPEAKLRPSGLNATDVVPTPSAVADLFSGPSIPDRRSLNVRTGEDTRASGIKQRGVHVAGLMQNEELLARGSVPDRAVPSRPAVAIRRPSGLKVAFSTAPSCPFNTAISDPLAEFHMRAVLS